MTDQNSTNEKPLPELGATHEPVYVRDFDYVVREKLRAYLTSAVHVHEEKHKGHEVEDSLPCLSLSIPCYLNGATAEDYTLALGKPMHVLAALESEADRLGYTVLGATPAMFGVSEESTYQSPVDRAPGWKVEMTATKYTPQFFGGENDHHVLTRLWLELSLKTHGPSYVRVMQEAQAGNEVNRKLQEIMGSGNLRA